MNGWVSPRLKIKFEHQLGEVKLYQPDGAAFENYLEIAAQRRLEQKRADLEQKRADLEQKRADLEQKEKEQALLMLNQERERAKRLAEKLRALGIDPDKT